MNDNLRSLEDIITDENFLAWFHKNNDQKAKKWKEWLLQNPGQEEIIREAIAFLKSVSLKEKSLPAEQIENASRKLNHKLNESRVKKLHFARKTWLIPAAAVLLCIVGFGVWKSFGTQTILGGTYGHITEYKLPDGTKVTLNANSKITLNRKWENGKDREVWLKGEAYFQVVKTSLKNKFVVHGNNMDIIVTGTKFNAVNRDDESSVLLTEGSVLVKTKDGSEIKMQPGDFVKFENTIALKKPVNEEKVLAWKQSKLVFDNTPLTEVAAIISRYYGVTVVFTDSSIGAKKIGGVMPNDNLDVLIQSLKAIAEFKITKRDSEIIISNP
ncbi:MAG TPA: FecR domain-containing protein [Flavisolibacter sp.]|nr:FecR domain-containing protein [Flavisolibacter sp.]